MAANDKEDWFKRHFNNVMAELARQAAAKEKLKEKREGEDVFLRKARAEVFHIIERYALLQLVCICVKRRQIALVSLIYLVVFILRMKLDGILERSEREKMFREEYTRRRIDNHYKLEKTRWHDANLFLMAQEDHLASRIRAEEQEESATQKNLMDQQTKVKELLKLEEEKERIELLERKTRGEVLKENHQLKLVINTDEYLKHVQLKDETLEEVTELIKTRLGVKEECPQQVLCNCHHEWTSSLQLMKACAKRVDSTVREAIDRSQAVVTVSGQAHRLEQEAGGGGETLRENIFENEKRSPENLMSS
jgi:hypothetical protein